MRMWIPICIVLCLLGALAFKIFQKKPVEETPHASADFGNVPKTLAELLALPPDELEKLDVAVINLLTAAGLRGSENLDIRNCLATLDQWAKHVERETQRHYHRFVERPQDFNNSLGYFRMKMLGTVLIEDLKMQYQSERKDQSKRGVHTRKDADEFFNDSKYVFLHGLLSGDRSGTCASMPFLYVAIAQRLGYPVNLAATEGHFYVRYEEDDGTHLNVEATATSRFKTPPDEEYKNLWDFPTTDEAVKNHGWLRPLSKKEILGHSLLTRSAVLHSMKRRDEEIEIWNQVGKYLEGPGWKNPFAEMKRRSQWESLWSELEKLRVPEGPNSEYLRDRKARVQSFMARSTHITSIEWEIQNLKKELAEHEKQTILARDSAPSLLGAIAPQAQQPQETGVVRIKTLRGREMFFPAERIPEPYRKSVPPELFAMIVTMDNEAEIEAEMWAHFFQSQRMQQAQQTVESSGGRVAISENQIPVWFRLNGIPLQLQSRLQKLRTAEEIIAEMTMFAAEEAQLANLEKTRSIGEPSLPPTWRPKERLTMKEFANQLGIRENSLPYHSANQEVPPELQRRIAAKTQYIREGREHRILDEIRSFESEQMQKRFAMERIQRRRAELDQQLLTHPPVQIEIVSENGTQIAAPITSAQSLPLTPPRPTPITPVEIGKGNP